MAKLTLKQIHMKLTDHLATNKEYPVVMFDDKESVPRLLRGRSFMFGADTGTDKANKKFVAIGVIEIKGVQQEPLVTLFGADKAKDRRFRTYFHGKSLLPDSEVNTLLHTLSSRLDAMKLMANVNKTQEVSDVPQTH